MRFLRKIGKEILDKFIKKHVASSRSEVLNPIRTTLEKDFKIPETHDKNLINFTLGEPTKANGYPLPDETKEAIIEAVESEKYNGYTHSSSHPDARQAVVNKYSTEEAPFDKDDVVLTFGCSGAQYTVFSAMCESGDNVLVPRPGFPLCLPITQNLGVELRYYDLDPEDEFSIKLDTVESQIDNKTKFILVVNPSNPCGSVFSKEHIEDIIALAEKHQVPLVADEIYYGFSYDDSKPFHSFAHVNTEIPLITFGAISKTYCVPGWRLGWTIVYNRGGYFDNILANMQKLAMIWLHPSSLVQQALVKILRDVPESYFEKTKTKLKEAYDKACEVLTSIRGVKPVRSKGAMYMMVLIEHDEFEDIEDDVNFCKKLLNEQNAFVLPSTCFFAKNMFRIVLCYPLEKIEELGLRINEFCENHYKK